MFATVWVSVARKHYQCQLPILCVLHCAHNRAPTLLRNAFSAGHRTALGMLFWGSHSVHNTSKYRWGLGLQHQTPGSSQSSSQAMPMQIAIGRLFHKQWLLHWNLKHRHAKGLVREKYEIWNRKIMKNHSKACHQGKRYFRNLYVITVGNM